MASLSYLLPLALALKRPHGARKLTKPGGGREVGSGVLHDLAGRMEVASFPKSSCLFSLPCLQQVGFLRGGRWLSSQLLEEATRLRNGRMCASALVSFIQLLASQRLGLSYGGLAHWNLGQQGQVVRWCPGRTQESWATLELTLPWGSRWAGQCARTCVSSSDVITCSRGG